MQIQDDQSLQVQRSDHMEAVQDHRVGAPQDIRQEGYRGKWGRGLGRLRPPMASSARRTVIVVFGVPACAVRTPQGPTPVKQRQRTIGASGSSLGEGESAARGKC